MNADTPRLRMFAGPNGSGKSTLKIYLPPALLGVYLNPDEIELEIRRHNILDLSAYGITSSAEEILSFFGGSPFLKSEGYADITGEISFQNGRLSFGKAGINSYLASVSADFLRQKLMEQGKSFTLETVMSHASKVQLLAQAQACGYRTYLYFVATDDPAINISRVHSRVRLGGHSVPEDRIEKRYYRSLDLLMPAIRKTNRAYIFDNSRDNADRKHTWLAEITEGQRLELKTDQIPAWFKHAILNKIG